MNIFALYDEPDLAAQAHCDKHVVKMITETAQLLSTALRELGVDNIRLYRRTHVNHPCAVWVRETRGNYNWTRRLLRALLEEYDYRYGGEGKFERAREILVLTQTYSLFIPPGERTPFALAMPDDYRGADAVASYRRYYQGEKADFCVWTNRPKPEWFRG